MTTPRTIPGFVAPADGWVEFEPYGEFPNQRAGVIQVIDREAAAAIANAFSAQADDPRFAGMLVDRDHLSQNLEEETRAYAWLMQVRPGATGLEGQFRWTSTGLAAIEGGDYRFFSTEYDRNDLVFLDCRDPSRVRPVRLSGLSLTNMPNNRGGKPITNRAPLSRRPALALRPAGPLAAPNCAQVASQLMLVRAQEHQAATRQTFEESWRAICNRYPALNRLMNRAADAGFLTALEPVAHAAYLTAVGDGTERELIMAGGKFAQTRENYLGAIKRLAIDFPELGFEGRWEKLKETDPEMFWGFVATFADV